MGEVAEVCGQSVADIPFKDPSSKRRGEAEHGSNSQQECANHFYESSLVGQENDSLRGSC